jgi:hypothetical protein
MFLTRYDLGEVLVTAAELTGLCIAAVPIFHRTLGLLENAASTTTSVDTEPVRHGHHWGVVPNLFCARLFQDGTYHVDADCVSRQPVEQPEIVFAMDWPMRDAQWRRLEETFLWPTMQRTLSDAVDAGSPGTRWQRHSVTLPFTR